MTVPFQGGAVRKAGAWRFALSAGLLALLAGASLWVAPISQFDGGIAASSATFTLHGLVPYRDYWLLYGPLSGLLLALPTALFGASADLSKAVGLFAIAVEAALLCGIALRWTHAFPAVLIGAVTPLMVSASLGLELSAWTVAMIFALSAALLRFERGPTILAGILVGFASLARHDVGGYLLLALMLMEGRRSVLLGFGLVVVPAAMAVLLVVPAESLFEQLVWFPIVGQRQFRGLPSLDLMFSPAPAAAITLALVWLPRLLIVAAIFRGIRDRLRDVLVLATFAALCQLQALGRGDFDHLAMAAIPAMPLAAIWIRPSHLRSGVALASVLALAVVMVLLGRSMRDPVPNAADTELLAAVRVVTEMTAREEPIFVGLTANRHTTLNPLIAYHLADRKPGTSTTMYNPGVTNTADRQAQMVEDLERSGTNVLILNAEWAELFEPWNDSRHPGASILDEYIASNFRLYCDLGSVDVMVRRASPHAAGCPPIRQP